MGPFKSVAVSLPLLSTNPCPLLLTNQNGSGVSIRSGGNALFVQTLREDAPKHAPESFRPARTRKRIAAGL